MNQIWGVSHGDYSDYSLLCLFMEQTDALAYAQALYRNDAIVTHDKRGKLLADGQPWNREHSSSFETCTGSECRRYRAGAERQESGRYRIESFDLYAAGEIAALPLDDD